jgi:hypothetical protein
MTSTRHKWAAKAVISPQKSERQCVRCETVLVSRHEYAGGRELHWKEFWRDCELICSGGPTPPCDARLEELLTDRDRAGADQNLHLLRAKTNGKEERSRVEDRSHRDQ